MGKLLTSLWSTTFPFGPSLEVSPLGRCGNLSKLGQILPIHAAPQRRDFLTRPECESLFSPHGLQLSHFDRALKSLRWGAAEICGNPTGDLAVFPNEVLNFFFSASYFLHGIVIIFDIHPQCRNRSVAELRGSAGPNDLRFVRISPTERPRDHATQENFSFFVPCKKLNNFPIWVESRSLSVGELRESVQIRRGSRFKTAVFPATQEQNDFDTEDVWQK